MRKTNSQIRKERIKKREVHIRKNSHGISNWSEKYVKEVLDRNNIKDFSIKDGSQCIVIKTSFGYWYIEHDNKVVTLKHSNFSNHDNNEKLRGGYHKQDVFFTLNQCLEYIIKHDNFKGYR
ncbi:hypothetical protein ACWN8V_06895 [Vagococcus elongatus]|uniref:Uncharacterized protein n=1 Tax=Vagococcus elongatus TaxID=180344 RepID=A0A430AW29_9ENTE|nr:hypothetical protein [Vagococcus elongatus]RSU12261.1 hypothetical protein CBF29_06585 [Vagococcus elongatus]